MIPKEQIDKLMEIRGQMNIPGRINLCPANGSWEKKEKDDSMNEGQIEAITKAVSRE